MRQLAVVRGSSKKNEKRKAFLKEIDWRREGSIRRGQRGQR
jgi:hypothetical protein